MSQAPPSSESASRPALVLGTAGHIDHGKTALIRALTGVDTDRLPEEKARGITIDLGFAPLDLGDGLRLSVVDVPGHEKLVRTMVAGASGIDLVLLVVAADEGVMPQTREHLAICELLGVRTGVVALTKLDLVDDEMAELARDEISEALASTGLEQAPVVGVSALRGTGLDDLRDVLRRLARAAPARTTRSGPPRLAVDRVFAMRGFGTVVTGTLVGAALAVGDAVELLPSGRRARVRGVQSHGEAAEAAEPGARCALNLQGVDVADVARGDVVTRPDALAPTHTADVELWWLPGAPGSDAPAVSVELLTGTSERRARLAPIGPGGDRERITPGWRGFARLHVDGPRLALVPGDRFVARGFARTNEGGSTWGGGVVLDVAPPHRRRSDPEVRRELEAFAGLDPIVGLRLRVARAGWQGADPDALAAELGLDPDALDRGRAALETGGDLVRCGAGGGERWLATRSASDLEGRLGRALDAFHAAEPLRPGMPRASLQGSLPENVPAVVALRAIERMAERGEVIVERDLVRRPDHAPRVDSETRSLLERIAREARAAGLEPTAPREWAEQLGVAPDRLRDLLAHLERDGLLVRAPGDLWFDREHVDTLRERVVAHLREHGALETPAYKSLIGTTRRTAVPLMELFDEERLTRRDGNTRVLRRRS